jgi:putative sterol carrier protein
MADNETIAGSFEALKDAFHPEKTQGVNKTIEFKFNGREPGIWNITVNNGTYSYAQGPAESPAAKVETDSDDWLAVLSGKLNAVSAFMGGKLKISGDMSVMMSFQNWFVRPQ